MPFPYASALPRRAEKPRSPYKNPPRRALAPRGGFAYVPLWAEKGGAMPLVGREDAKTPQTTLGKVLQDGRECGMMEVCF